MVEAPVYRCHTWDLQIYVISQPFSLHRGCPLSPLLFFFAIEPLAFGYVAVSKNPGCENRRIRTYYLAICWWYYYYNVFFLSDLTSIPMLVSLIKSFGEFSGYKVNNSKSTILFLNKHDRDTYALFNREFYALRNQNCPRNWEYSLP